MYSTVKVAMVRHAVSACRIAKTIFNTNAKSWLLRIFECHGFDMHPSNGL